MGGRGETGRTAGRPNIGDWLLDRTYALIHRLQPSALIIPNHHRTPRPGEDVQTFERDLPGANSAGFNTTTIGALPLETSETTNDSWGVTTQKRYTTYVHLLYEGPDRGLTLPHRDAGAVDQVIVLLLNPR